MTILNYNNLSVSHDDSRAIYVQLYERLVDLIETGHLTAGYALPPVRKLADTLKINAGTVARSYRELEKNGYIYSRRGSGSYVADPPERSNGEERRSISDLEIHDPEFLTEKLAADVINMNTIALNPDIISIQQFKRLMNEVLDRDGGHAFGYQEAQGFMPLRKSIARYLAHSGIKASFDRLQIISGAQQGIDIVARALLTNGDYVFTEAPTYPGALAAFRARGAKIIDIPLEPDGPNMEILEERLKKFTPRLIYVMPTLQNPTGATYSREKRARLMGLARYYNAYVLEDDYLSELCYSQNILPPLKAGDRDERVIYLKSFSKIFMPGLRLAFLLMPSGLTKPLLAMKQLTDIATSGLTQRVFDLYLREGLWNEHVASIKSIYETQFNFTLKAAARLLPKEVTFHVPVGGLSLWLHLPQKLTATKLAKLAQQEKIALTDGSDFYPRATDHHHVRISFATLTLQEIERGMRILGEILTRELKNK